MAGDSPYKTFEDLYTSVLTDFKDSTNATMVTNAKRWINEAQEQVVRSAKRDFLNKTYHVVVEAAVSTACTVTNGSVTVTKTGTAALPVTSTQEHKFFVTGFPEVYDVVSFSATTITLASAFQGTSATGVTGNFFQSSVLIDADIRNVHKVYHERNGLNDLRNKGAEDLRNIIQSDPTKLDYAVYWSLYGYDNVSVTSVSEKRRLLVYPYPSTAYTIHLDCNIYVPLLSNDSDEPIIPVQYRQMLYWYAIFKFGQFHQDADVIQLGLANYNSWLDKFNAEMFPQTEMPRLWPNNDKWIDRTSGYRYRRSFRFDP